MGTGLLLRHPASLAHETGPHPENAERMRAIERALAEASLSGVEPATSPLATRAMLERVHSPAHVDRIEAFCAAGGGLIDADTVATAASWEAALHAAGGAAEGAERVLGGDASFAVSAHRPPGHHAERERAMGFCLFNSVAVAAAHAIAACGAERVMIVDWDVHHGNGTAEIFDARADVLFVSIHESPLYPGTGSAAEVGTGAGEGATINLPVPGGTGGEEFRALVEHVVGPLGRSFGPDLIAVSAGYDAHVADPLSTCAVETGDYGEMSASLRDLGRELGAPVLVCLEGGYDPDALAASVLATIEALAGERPASAVDPGPAREARRRIAGMERWAGAFG